jgi:putative hydrolases of HD superfamily
VRLAYEWGELKRLPRRGWLRAGVERPESVADHTARTAMLAWVIAGLEGADQERAAALALFHDSQEPRIGDLDHVERNYRQAEALPQPLAAGLRALVGEYERRASREAECARDADKLDMLLTALEYREAGWGSMDPFVNTAVAALRTSSGRRLGEAAMRVSPAAWWQASTAAWRPFRSRAAPTGVTRASPAAYKTPGRLQVSEHPAALDARRSPSVGLDRGR